jgi:hypothetical protein
LHLLLDHVPVNARPRRELIAGVIGTDARFNGNHLVTTVTVWSQAAIDGIKNGKKRQLSCAYQYTPPDMTPGDWRGQSCDGVMRNLTGTHVALVESGRGGLDCAIVLDNMEDPVKNVLQLHQVPDPNADADPLRAALGVKIREAGKLWEEWTR